MFNHDYEPQTSEQQQELLIQGRFGPPPRSANHLADRMEASGAKIESILQRFNVTCNVLFFVAGWVTIAAALLALVDTLFGLSFVGFVESVFLLFFGIVMMVLDVPGAPQWAARYRRIVFRQIKFLTRLTGRALWNIYLGVMILVTLWPSSDQRGSGVSFLMGILFSLYVLSVSAIGLAVGIQKSMMLERVRREIANSYKGNYSEVFRKYAITDVGHGLQFTEFNRMCSDYSQGRIQWQIDELAMIYNALDEHQKGAINEKEFCEWMTGSLTYL